MENTGRIRRSKKTGGSRYTSISNEILQSKTLTPEEKSILVHLLSLPEDWVTYKTVIWKEMNMGCDKFYKHWTGLVNKGYIISIKVIKPNGQFAGYDHEIVEEPILPVNQVTENQETVIQYMDNQVTEIQETGVQLTGLQEVNKVITKQSNNKQSNNIQSNNTVAKEDIITRTCEDIKLDTVEEIEQWCISNNREITNSIEGIIKYHSNYLSMSIDDKITTLISYSKELELS